MLWPRSTVWICRLDTLPALHEPYTFTVHSFTTLFPSHYLNSSLPIPYPLISSHLLSSLSIPSHPPHLLLSHFQPSTLRDISLIDAIFSGIFWSPNLDGLEILRALYRLTLPVFKNLSKCFFDFCLALPHQLHHLSLSCSPYLFPATLTRRSIFISIIRVCTDMGGLKFMLPSTSSSSSFTS